MSSDLTCPHCGFTVDEDMSDLWEYDQGKNDYDCPNCEKELILDVEIVREYSLIKKDCKDGEHTFGQWYRTDIDKDTLERWRTQSKSLSEEYKKGPYSWFSRKCTDCDEKEYSIDYPFKAEVEQDDVEPRFKKRNKSS